MRVAGYYAVSASSVSREDLEREDSALTKGLGRVDPYPAVLLGRLGVDTGAQGHGLGQRLVVDALLRSLQVAANVGVTFVVVHARRPELIERYQRITPFYSCHSEPTRLLIRMNDVEAAVNAAAGEAR